MASRLVSIISIVFIFAFGSSAQAQESTVADNAASKTLRVSEEVIVVEQKTRTTEGLQIAIAPTVADAHSLVLEDLSERLTGNIRAASNHQLDI